MTKIKKVHSPFSVTNPHILMVDLGFLLYLIFDISKCICYSFVYPVAHQPPVQISTAFRILRSSCVAPQAFIVDAKHLKDDVFNVF